MSHHKATVRICDICKKRVSDEGEITFGGHVHSGWFLIDQTSGSTKLSELKKKREWDVCGIDCLRLLVAKLGSQP